MYTYSFNTHSRCILRENHFSSSGGRVNHSDYDDQIWAQNKTKNSKNQNPIQKHPQYKAKSDKCYMRCIKKEDIGLEMMENPLLAVETGEGTNA